VENGFEGLTIFVKGIGCGFDGIDLLDQAL
jgi:hypothetical protein